MKRLALWTAIAALLCALTGSLRAQLAAPTDVDAATPWNQFFGQRIALTFSSISGDTLPVPGSTFASPYDTTFSLPLPFGVRFVGPSGTSWYPKGSIVKVGIAGFLSFNAGTEYGTAPYVLAPDPVYRSILMPFWSDLRTTGKPYEGIYHRLTIVPSTYVLSSYDTVLTIEWRVETTRPPNDQGAFQLRMIKHPAKDPGDSCRVEFQFIYDGASMLATRGVPGTFGAQIGAKNIGQSPGAPPPLDDGVDDDKYLLMAPRSADSVITRLRTHASSYAPDPNTPDWYATWEVSTPSFFHFLLPGSGFRIKPADLDSKVIDILPDGTSTLSPAPVVRSGGGHTGTVTIANAGLDPLFQVPVAVYILDGATAIDSTITTIDTLLPGHQRAVTFSIPALGAGIYRMMGVTRVAGDENRADDSLSRLFYVRPAIDAMPFELISPVLGSSSRYVVDSAIDISASVAGIGTDSSTTIRYSYVVRDTGDSVVGTHSDSTVVPTLLPDSVKSLTLGSWTPDRPGLYYVTVIASTPGDTIPANDTLASIRSADRLMRGAGRPSTPMPFHVYLPYDLATGAPTSVPHVPFRGDTVTYETPIRVIFANLGGLDATASGHVIIRNSAGMVVYDTTSAGTTLAGGGALTTLVFPSFSIPATDDYCIRAYPEYSVSDANRANDTVSWCFYGVVDTSGGPKRAIGPAIAPRGIDVAPNPTEGLVRLRFSSPISGPIVMSVTDLLGATVVRRELDETAATDLPLDLRGLATGIYLIRIQFVDGEREVVPVVVR